MTANTCPCGQAINDQGTLCWACTNQLAGNLRSIPDLLHELDITSTRQSRNGNGTGRATERPIPYDQRAATARTDLLAKTRSWTALLAENLDTTPRRLEHPAEWLADNTNTLRMRDWAPDCHTDIRDATRTAWKAVDRPPERWFAGHCTTNHPGDDGPITCGAPLYGTPDNPTVNCRHCGTTWDVLECRTWLLNAAQDRLEPATVIATALTKLGQEVTPTLIRKWRQRGRITPSGVNSKGQPLYRLGDVTNLIRTGVNA